MEDPAVALGPSIPQALPPVLCRGGLFFVEFLFRPTSQEVFSTIMFIWDADCSIPLPATLLLGLFGFLSFLGSFLLGGFLRYFFLRCLLRSFFLLCHMYITSFPKVIIQAIKLSCQKNFRYFTNYFLEKHRQSVLLPHLDQLVFLYRHLNGINFIIISSFRYKKVRIKVFLSNRHKKPA